MALAATFPLRKHSEGVKAVEHVHVTALSTDTTVTLTSTNLSRIDFILLGSNGLIYTAAPTYKNNTVTLAFTAPAGGYFGDGLLIGV